MKRAFAKAFVAVVDGFLSFLEWVERAWPYFCAFLIALFIVLKFIETPRATAEVLAGIAVTIIAVLSFVWGCSVLYDWAGKQADRREREAQKPKSEPGGATPAQTPKEGIDQS